jgi:hypothetical protein
LLPIPCLAVTCDRSVVFSGYFVSSTNKIDRHDITAILLKVTFDTISQTYLVFLFFFFLIAYYLHIRSVWMCDSSTIIILFFFTQHQSHIQVLIFLKPFLCTSILIIAYKLKEKSDDISYILFIYIDQWLYVHVINPEMRIDICENMFCNLLLNDKYRVLSSY